MSDCEWPLCLLIPCLPPSSSSHLIRHPVQFCNSFSCHFSHSPPYSISDTDDQALQCMNVCMYVCAQVGIYKRKKVRSKNFFLVEILVTFLIFSWILLFFLVESSLFYFFSYFFLNCLLCCRCMSWRIASSTFYRHKEEFSLSTDLSRLR